MQSATSAIVSVSGSRLINAAQSLRATAIATSTASDSMRASTSLKRPATLLMAAAICSRAISLRRALSALACARPAATPLRYPRASASATLRATSAAVALAPRDGLEKSRSNRYLAGSPISVHQFVVGAVLRQHDFALGGEVLGEIHQQGLRLVDIAQSHWSHRLHVVGQHLCRTARHVAHEECLDLFVRALQRDAEFFLVDVTHQGLGGRGVELDQVVEGEHQRLDALGGFTVFLFQ